MKKNLINFSKSCDGEMQISFPWPNVSGHHIEENNSNSEIILQFSFIMLCLQQGNIEHGTYI